MSYFQVVKPVALVTGASAGIGKAIARRLLAEGFVVYVGARRVAQMADLAEQGALPLSLDVTDDASMGAAVDRIIAEQGHIDALVNNAGYGSYGALEDVPMDEARRQFEVNVFGLVRLCQLVLPSMRKAGAGTIVNISSMGGRIWTPLGGWYHATKHAVEVLSDAMRMEVAPFGVRVVVVQPGAIESEWAGISAKNLLATAEGSAYGDQITPMASLLGGESAQLGKPEVVADAVYGALSAAKPRRRYATPLDAKVMIWLHWLLPDWAWERAINAMLRFYARRQPKAVGTGA